jgi:hypothetical protein
MENLMVGWPGEHFVNLKGQLITYQILEENVPFLT